MLSGRKRWCLFSIGTILRRYDTPFLPLGGGEFLC